MDSLRASGCSAVSLELPAPNIGNITELTRIVVEWSQDQRKMQVSQAFLVKDYLDKVIDLFSVCEDLENMEYMHDFFLIFKSLSSFSFSPILIF